MAHVLCGEAFGPVAVVLSVLRVDGPIRGACRLSGSGHAPPAAEAATMRSGLGKRLCFAVDSRQHRAHPHELRAHSTLACMLESHHRGHA